MEPNLEEMSDYEKPMGDKKKKTILIAFAVAAVIILGYALLMATL